MRRLGRRRPPPPWRLTVAPRASSTYTALPGASFHGASVEEMVAAAAAGEWRPPPLPGTVAEVIASEAARAPVPVFGHALRDAHFGLDPSWTFINHGAFGAPCRLGVAVAAAWRSHAERQPLKFIDRELFAHMVESQRVVAEWIGASADELVLVPNATTGLNAVIASVVGGGGGGCGSGGGGVVMGVGDEVLYLDVGYGSVTTMLHRACRRSGARPVAVPIAADLPFSAAPSEVLRRVEAAMTPRTRMLIVDDVTSNTALVLPVAELCALCRSRGVLSLVDGAHSIGSRPTATLPYLRSRAALDESAVLGRSTRHVAEVGADFIVGNLHKWGCAPRGTGFMYVASAAHRTGRIVEPPIVSHGFGAGFASSMVWAGAKDYSEFLALPALIRGWWRAEDAPGPLQDPAGAHQDAPGMAATAVAPDMARRSGSLAESVNYQRRTLSEAVAMLSDAWGTAPLVPASDGFNMSLVRLPPLDPRSVLHFASGDCKNRSSSSSSGTTTAAAAAAVSADSTTSDLPASATLTGKAVQDALHFGHAIECPVKTVGGQLYVRISAAVYNERSDYEALARAVDAMRRR